VSGNKEIGRDNAKLTAGLDWEFCGIGPHGISNLGPPTHQKGSRNRPGGKILPSKKVHSRRQSGRSTLQMEKNADWKRTWGALERIGSQSTKGPRRLRAPQDSELHYPYHCLRSENGVGNSTVRTGIKNGRLQSTDEETRGYLNPCTGLGETPFRLALPVSLSTSLRMGKKKRHGGKL